MPKALSVSYFALVYGASSVLTPLATESAIVIELSVEHLSICFRVCGRQEALDDVQLTSWALEKCATKDKETDGENATSGVPVLFLLEWICNHYLCL